MLAVPLLTWSLCWCKHYKISLIQREFSEIFATFQITVISYTNHHLSYPTPSDFLHSSRIASWGETKALEKKKGCLSHFPFLRLPTLFRKNLNNSKLCLKSPFYSPKVKTVFTLPIMLNHPCQGSAFTGVRVLRTGETTKGVDGESKSIPLRQINLSSTIIS